MPGTVATEVKAFLAPTSKPAGFGVLKTCQLMPSQCCASVSRAAFSLKYEPTAHTSVAEIEETLTSAVREELRLGDGTICQVLPFQRWISVDGLPSLTR